MKKLIYILTIPLICFSLSIDLAISEDKNITPDQKRKDFADLLLKQPGIKKVEWKKTSTLWVQIDERVLELNPKDPAKFIAQNLALGGLAYTQNGICVNVYVDPLHILSKACQSNDKKIPLTHNQKDYARVLSEEKEVLYAIWVSTYELYVTLGLSSSSSMKEKEWLADLKASELVAKGLLYTEQNICVKISILEFGDLVYKCGGDQAEL